MPNNQINTTQSKAAGKLSFVGGLCSLLYSLWSYVCEACIKIDLPSDLGLI